MARRFFESCNPFRLMYAQSLLMTWVRGMGPLPTTAASFALGCIGLMNAGFGARFLPEDFFLARFAAFFRAVGRLDFFADFFLPAVFFLLVVAIASLP
jgi:hypothetical protein